MPRVSVLMTVYNGMPFLPEAVESLFAQTLSDFELVVVDDGSTDGTGEYLASVTDPRLRVITRENGGTSAAANQGLTACVGEYVARMDADDVSLPTRLAEQAAYLDAHPEVGLVGVQMAPLGERGVGRSLALPTSHRAIDDALMAGRHGLGHSCIMFRAELLRRLGGYWKLRQQDAWDMMLRMGEAAELANLDRVLHHYRVHRGSINGRGMSRLRFGIDYARELARRRRNGLPPLSVEEYQANLERRPWWRRLAERVDIYARSHYRLALAEIYGGRRARGAVRMAWAAACQPKLTAERIGRALGRRFRGRGTASTT